MRCYKNLAVIVLLMITLLLSHSVILANETLINMNFREADIRDVLRTIAELADVNLVTDGSVGGSITIHLKNLSFNDSLKLITEANSLSYKWYENTVVVATPSRIEEIYADIEVTTVGIEHADSTEVESILGSVYPEVGITIDHRNDRLIFKGNGEDIAAARDLLAKLDTEKEEITEIIPIPPEKAEFLQNYIEKVYPDLVIESDDTGNFVIYGTPYDISSAKLLLEKLVNQFNTDGLNDVEDMDSVNIIETLKIKHVPVDYIQGQISQMYPEINIISDNRNNQIVFNGTSVQYNQIKQLVNKIDIQSADEEEGVSLEEKVLTFEDVDIEDVQSALSETSPSLEATAYPATNQIVLRGTAEDISLAVAMAESLNQQMQKVTAIIPVDYASLDDISEIIPELYPEVGFKFHQQKRELIVTGQKANVDNVRDFMGQIDSPRKQVMIEVRVEEIIDIDSSTLGVNTEDVSQIQILDRNDDGLIDGLDVSFPQFFDMLNSNGSTKNLANPRLMTLSGESGRILLGERVPVIVESVEDDNVKNTVEYIEIGISMEFTPWVTTDNKINLTISPKVSNRGSSLQGSLPAINTREADTEIRLDDGETFAIAGLIREDLEEQISKVPLLGDIPIIGELFKRTTMDNQRTEVIIFITPHVMDKDLGELSDHVQEGLSNDIIISEPNQSSATVESEEDNQDTMNRQEETDEDTIDESETSSETGTNNNSSTEQADNSQNNNDQNNNDQDNNDQDNNGDSSSIDEDTNASTSEADDTSSNVDEDDSTNDEEDNAEDSSNIVEDENTEENNGGFQKLTQEELNEILGFGNDDESNQNSGIDDQESKTSEGNESNANETASDADLQNEEQDTEKNDDEEIQENNQNQQSSDEVNAGSNTEQDNDSSAVEEADDNESSVDNTTTATEEKEEPRLDGYHMYQYKLLSEVTVEELAEKFSVDEELIVEANRHINTAVGAYMNIPVPHSRIYIFKKDDTLWKIHSLFDVSVEEIKELNDIENENAISVGTEIVIPEK
ncbi:MAG: LysM peptidoglycan-binding domain-containing protein [Halanaerobiales bacterium]